MMKRVKANLIQNLGTSNQAVLHREMEMAKQKVKFEVAWQIFDEINLENE